jgi:hypothetical protein
MDYVHDISSRGEGQTPGRVLVCYHIQVAAWEAAIRLRKSTYTHAKHDESVSLRRLSGCAVRRKAHHGSTLDSGITNKSGLESLRSYYSLVLGAQSALEPQIHWILRRPL